jgi:hypothetical protein
MAAATTTRTATAAEVVVALLARPPSPLLPTVGPTHRGDLRPPVAGAHDYVPQPRARWTAASAGLRGHTEPLCVSRPQDGTLGSAQVGTSSRWPTPSAPWRSTRPRPRSRTGWRTPARRTTPLHQLVIFLFFILWPHLILYLPLSVMALLFLSPQ